MTLALSPKQGYPGDLRKIRELADNQIKEELLRIPEVGNVEVFGGHQPEVLVSVQPDYLSRFGIAITDVMAAITAQNQNIPQGIIIKKEGQYLFKTEGAATRIGQLADLVVARRDTGIIHLRDIAKIQLSEQEPQSVYHGNGKEAIGINILRTQSGHTLDPILAVETYLPRLKAAYPFINFETSFTQKHLITLSVDNMLTALRDAVIVTVIVIFLFLGNLRAMALCAVSIPFTYLITFAIMWLFGFEFHMVTLTGVILAVGMLLDDAIVVIENIERHYRQEGKNLKDLVAGGTEEVMLAIFSGTYATIVVLLPIIFVGGYVQTVLRPLTLSLTIALIASFVVSVTIIPILAPYILRVSQGKSRFERFITRWSDGILNGIRDFFGAGLTTALRHRFLFVGIAFLLWWVSIQYVQPFVGRNVQPPMDTGIIKISFEADANSSLGQANVLLNQMENIIKKQKGVVSISATLGSEPSVVSFGSGKNPQQGTITVNLVDRYHRQQSMWEVQKTINREFLKIPGLKSVDVFDYGATAMSSLKAFVDTMVTGPDPKEAYRIGEEVKKRLLQTQGLKSVSLSWGLDKKEVVFTANRERCSYYGISPKEIAAQVQAAVQGGVSSIFRVAGEDGFPVRIRLGETYRNDISGLESFRVHTPSGDIPLSLLGAITTNYVPSLLTRQGMQNSIDVYGYREKAALSHIMANVQKALKGIKLPPGYKISQEGDAKQGNENQIAFNSALLIAMVLLYFSLVPAFQSFIHPLTIMTAIPLAMIGAVWSLLITNKTQSISANMGLILLAGIVVKNSILLIDFIEMAKRRGLSTVEAVRESVRVRTRPILMTAFGTAVGMLPIALERAIGLERLSPLAVVAIGGLMVSTFLTLLYVPIFYTIFEDAVVWLKMVTARIQGRSKATTQEVDPSLQGSDG